MKPHHFHKRCGCSLIPMTSKQNDLHLRHPRAAVDSRGRLISNFGPGRVTRRRQAHRMGMAIARDGRNRLLNTLCGHLTPQAVEAMDRAIAEGLPPLAVLLHGCKGACVAAQDYERAAKFLDMACGRSNNGPNSSHR